MIDVSFRGGVTRRPFRFVPVRRVDPVGSSDGLD